MSSLVLTLTETLRYRGAIGQWSWVLHRLTGIGVIFFLVLHVIDTSWAVFYPELYVHAIAIYQTPLFTIGEFALVFAVVYHALNGLRIIFFDFRPSLWRYQQRAAVWVLVGTIVLLVPSFVLMLMHVVNHYATNPTFLPLLDVIAAQVPFLVGMAIALIVSILLSFVYDMIAGSGKDTPEKASSLERFWWRFMRLSGLLIVPLVFGHLALMHLIQGVFDIQGAHVLEAGISAVGTFDPNLSGTAVEFVADRWGTLVAGVFVWRVYDFALLALATAHGFNGLRFVLTDYAPTRTLKRAMAILCVIGALVLLATGGGALIIGVQGQAIRDASRALCEQYTQLGDPKADVVCASVGQ